jgi:hypothetical protein
MNIISQILTVLSIVSIVMLFAVAFALAQGYRFAPVYKITYAPEDSRNSHLPIQRYHIIRHPRHLAWKSQAKNRLFTALSARHAGQFNAFRADRVLSVNWAGWQLISPEAQRNVAKTLTTPEWFSGMN